MAQRDIVVIGASAGGVEALQKLIGALPASLPASVFVVLHIPPDTPSRLDEVLRHVSKLPVEAARDDAPIVPGQVTVALPDRHLVIEPNRVRVARGPRENRARPAIDVLFRSAAYHFGARAIGVVLSGNMDDGTAGLWTIKDRGGIALVQSPDEAFCDSMPQSAIDHVAVDQVLPAAQLAQFIAALCLEAAPQQRAAAKGQAMAQEIKFAEGAEAPAESTLELGQLSPNTCPTCHGVLARIDEGSIVRYRCHTGHAFSLQTLFAQLDEEIDNALAAALRAVHERTLLLEHLERQAKAAGDEPRAAGFARQRKESRKRAQQLGAMSNGNGGSASGRAAPAANA